MIKKISCILFIMLFIIINCLTVQAASATADLNLSNDKVKAGDTFTITLKINCADGINGVTGIKYSYDNKVLELISSGVNDTNFVNIGNNTNIDLICNSNSKITTSNIYTFKFKVKESVTNVNETEFSLSNFSIDSDAINNSEVTIDAKKVNIRIIANEDTQDNKPDRKTEVTNTVVPSENTTSKDKKIQNSSTISNSTTNSDAKKTNTIKTIKELPKTGITTGIGIVILIVAGMAVVSYNKYSKLDK